MHRVLTSGFLLNSSLIYLRNTLMVGVLLVLVSPSRIWPCGAGEPDPLRIFRPLQITAALFPDGQENEYLSVLDQLAGTCDAPKGAKYVDRNLENWAALLKDRAGITSDSAALDSLIYRLSADEIKKASKNPDSIPGRLTSKGQSDILGYILYAKSVEPLVAPSNYWETPEPLSPEKAESYIGNALKQSSQQKDRNLKVRYLYQAMRLAHYSGQHSRALKILSQLPGGLKATDPLYFRILHLEAGALLKNNQTANGLGVLARMSAQEPEMMLRVSLDFDRYWATKGAYDAAFAKASREEKKALILLRFFSNAEPNLALIKQMTEMFPGDPALDYMLIREIDRLEDRLEGPLYYDAGNLPRRSHGRDIASGNEQDSGFSISAFLMKVWHWIVPPLEASPIAKIPAEEQKYMKDLADFIGKTAEGKKTRSPGTWKLAQGYLQMLLGQHSAARSSLSHSLVNPSESPFVRLQKRRINLLNVSAEKKNPDEELKKLILQDYASIKETDESSDYGCRWSDHAARLLLHRNMVNLHMKAGEEGEALLWEPDVSQIYSGTSINTYAFSALEKAENVMRKPAGAYEKKLIEISNATLATVVSRLGARRLKAGDYEGAVNALKKLKKDEIEMYYSERIEAGPFDNPFSEKFASGKKASDYNSYAIALRMQELQKEAKSQIGDKSARAYYRMGLAQFNMSHFGNWWSAVDTDWSIYYEYSDKVGDPQLKLARGYFENAISTAKDRELIAASRFMIATIAYLDSADTGYFSPDTITLADEQKTQFDRLADMDDTEFYKEVVRTCTYFMQYRQ